jgi:branched-chain amino acid transport system substrate-binding protein
MKRVQIRWITLAAVAVITVRVALPQSSSCGLHPPGMPPVRHIEPYAGEPEDLRPFSKFTAPYYQHYVDTNVYSGAARDVPDPDLASLPEIRIGFIGPIGTNPDEELGTRMLHGAQFAVEEVNAQGGYCGKPYKLMLHNDYDNWQAGAVYGANRPSDEAIWGASSNAVIKMVYDENDWAIFGSISSESTHIVLRVALRAEVVVVSSASTDPTVPETLIPWYFTDIQDDRVQSLTLARHIYGELHLKHVAILRVNNRYGRFGVAKFRDASRRLGHPIVVEQKFLPGDTDMRHQLKLIQDSSVDGIVLWTDQKPAALILQQMRELGMKQKVFGSHRTIGDELLQIAGPAAEGMEAVFPYDPTRQDPRWLQFKQHYETRFHEKPEQFASLAYDAMRILLQSIQKAGLNRARIHDALAQVYDYRGVTGDMIFDTNAKNVSPLFLATVHDGKIAYRPATMEKRAPTSELHDELQITPYARAGEDGIAYNGPSVPDTVTNSLRIAVIGPKAPGLIESDSIRVLLAQGNHGTARLDLIPVDSQLQWGQVSTALLDAVTNQHVVAILALDRDSAHLAEQFGVKFFLPVIAISDDRSLTSTNIPWIFRLPAGTPPEQALNCLITAIRAAGPNTQRVRELLASGRLFAGLNFRPAGEPF